MLNWGQPIATLTLAPGSIEMRWLLAVETIQDATYIKIAASGKWFPMTDLVAPCGPDGLPNLPIAPDHLLVDDCPAGAMIGKFGGSTANVSDPKPFAIGRCTIFAIPDKVIGPLYVGCNGAILPISIAETFIVEVWKSIP